ncbi:MULTISPECIES: hypothetical protein [Vibrio]|uniref:Uncharacterized protein n=1 Tax=Vibrio diabolicus TaxID=50719 RepID=A0AAX1XSV0_9VIBR|nr:MULTISPECIES: hypothetical protein [Vibrio]BCB45060.1 hypothetical protein Vag1382_41870 [Vibrio alginolyticus]MCF7453992.1 hypothetical protein [Vibrio sp. A1-1]MCK8062777.1 hypothetical protein [Vibrio sp. 1CM7H]MCQ9062951.1 hypothetical protein [Vibrio diabolicus]MCR9553367.1 hypothetical protein [Vibrio sp. RM-41-2A]
MEKYQSYKSIETKSSIRKMQRILDQLFSELDEQHRVTKENVVALTRQSQQRLMNYKELYLHKESIGEVELQIAYENMSVTEKQVADMGVSALTYIIGALDKAY